MFTYLNTFYETYPFVVYYLVAINTTTFFLYGLDKIYARSRSWRISENTLHALAFFGGSVGAIVGIKLFRHKTRKDSFLVILGVILLAQIALIYYLFNGI